MQRKDLPPFATRYESRFAQTSTPASLAEMNPVGRFREVSAFATSRVVIPAEDARPTWSLVPILVRSRQFALHDVAPWADHAAHRALPADQSEAVPRGALERRNVGVRRTGDDRDQVAESGLDSVAEVGRGSETANEDQSINSAGGELCKLMLDQREDLVCSQERSAPSSTIHIVPWATHRRLGQRRLFGVRCRG